jgi:hypothetical protein
MARKTIGQRITELEERKKALVARLGKQERAQDTRRKILLGALVLHRLENCNDARLHPPPRRLAAQGAARLSHP